ncbi:serine/threonine protein kinase [Neorhodopirellula lusitana]|uniref:serine/threonine protein kinase n=1 Tax=Neorhodopirellula lusitana TaxID=445327 RepID=UPI00384ABE6A
MPLIQDGSLTDMNAKPPPAEDPFETQCVSAVDSAELDDRLIACLERLAESDRACEPEHLLEYLSGDPADSFMLVELIKLSMAMAVQNGSPIWLEGYFEAMPGRISAATAPLDLVMEEIQLRRESGQTLDAESYHHRFPQFGTVLNPLLDTPSSESVTAAPRQRSTSELDNGTRIDDFEIIQMLGKGAFAHVYLAKQTSMARLVALKVSGSTGDEPRALAQFDHSNIVRVFDQRAVPVGAAGDGQELHLLYMQYHPGGTLSDVVAKVRQVSPSERIGRLYLQAIDENLLSASQVVPDRSPTRNKLSDANWPKLVAWVGIQLARALQTAHDAGVLHRDVKPANVLLTAEGIPQLADFNVSMAGSAGRAGAAASLGGSVGYMAPEHLRAMSATLMGSGDDVREQADLYSLAVLLWELWQGHRPFDCLTQAGSWTEVLDDQIQARDQPLVEPESGGTAPERVLESVLRDALSPDLETRPASGAALAGQLRLAMHPEAAKLFNPDRGSISAWLMRISPWWVATIAILLPNIAAGWFNYEYNQHEIMDPAMRAGLDEIAVWINSIAFPFAVGWMVHYTRASVSALKAARRGEHVGQEQLTSTLKLGHRAAVIGGIAWMIAGMIYPVLLRHRFEEFSTDDATHFFLSLCMCGGVAMIYPLFTLGLITTYVYYPQMVRPAMVDPNYERNAARMISQTEAYLLIAVLIPLVGLALMVFGESQSKGFMLTAITAGMVGLFGSFAAYRSIVQTWSQLGEVLKTDATSE